MIEPLWTERYRPKTLSDTILPTSLKATLQAFLDKNELPNLLFVGSAGVGKTTVARAMVEELGGEFYIINASMKGNIDTLRTEIQDYASTLSFGGGRKYVILDEADHLNPQSTQPALRNFMEEFSTNCGFILTCNYRDRIIEPLRSRCAEVPFKFNRADTETLAGHFFKRVLGILAENNVEFDKTTVAEVVKLYMPDWRRVLNELQRYSATGRIDTGILAAHSDDNIKRLLQDVKDKNFTAVRKWVAENDAVSGSEFFRRLYEQGVQALDPKSIPQLILILADYGYKQAFAADQQINTAACLVEIMASCSFK